MGTGRNRWPRRLLDLAAYAVGLTLVVALALLPLSLLAGANLNGVKIGLFVAGVLAFGYATVLHWPSRPDERRVRRTGGEQVTPDGVDPGTDSIGSSNGGGPREETGFEAMVGRVPPLERYEIPPVERFHPGTKLYVASLLMLAVSYAMEAVFDVQA